MEQENQFGDNSPQPQSIETKTRRKFLTRASAGVLITSIPGKSAWAGMQGSIVASGQGSDSAGGSCLQVYSPGYWKNKGAAYSIGDFKFIFGGNPLAKNGSSTTTYSGNYSLLDILRSPGGGGKIDSDQRGGPSNVNVFLVSSYLNAKYDGTAVIGSSTLINFPASGGLSTPYASAEAMAKALYLEASVSTRNANAVGESLSSIVDVYHIDNDFSDSGNPAGLAVCN